MIDLGIIILTVCTIDIVIKLLVYSAKIVKFFRTYSNLQDTTILKMVKKHNSIVDILSISSKAIIGYCVLSTKMDAVYLLES